MKIISIRINHYLANWINSCTQKNMITISEFIRDLLHENITKGIADLANVRKVKLTANYQPSRREMGYIIFTAKLLEKLVLAIQKQGEILRNIAFEETENLLEQLNLNNYQEQRFCISLEDSLFELLQQEACKLKLKVIPLIRKLVEASYIKNNINANSSLSELQKIAIKHQIMACKLLEKLTNQHINNSDEIIEEVKLKTNKVLLQLCPETNT